MEAATTSPASAEKSPLDKPLGELTEDDIAQVTREDCRRFLKEKGMRRPSWNKSQAIQQVISLKALLEVRKEDDGDDDENNNAGRASSSTKRQQEEDDDSFSGRDKAHNPPPPPPPPPPPSLPPWQQKDAIERRTNLSSLSSPFLQMTSPETVGVSLRDVSDPVMAKESVADQMTVFYNGKVNVFDGVSPEKALVIMQFATSQEHCDGLPNSLVDLNQSFDPKPNAIPTITPHPPLPPMMAFATQGRSSMAPITFSQCPQVGAKRRNLQELEFDGRNCRKALLHRYLEKRKDRRTINCKKSFEGLSSNMEFYFAQNFGCKIFNEQHCKSDIVSPLSKLSSTPTRWNCLKNQAQSFCFPFDLNDTDVQEI